MKILIFSKGYPDLRQPYLKTFIRDEALLLHQEHDVMVVDGQSFRPSELPGILQPPSYPDDGFPVLRATYFSVPRQKFPALTALGVKFRFSKAIRLFRPDVVHAHQLYPGILGLMAAHNLGIPTVLTLHGADLYQSLRSKKIRTMATEVLKKTGRIICVGPRLHKDAAVAFPQFSDKTEMVLHGTDYDYFRPRENSPLSTPVPALSIFPRILCVARFVAKKGHILLLEAIAGSSVLRNCTFTLVGDITDQNCYKKVKSAIASLGLANITILPGLDREALRETFYAHDFYVQPSLDEPFGLALLEAIACGLPAVAFRSGGPDVIITPVNGFLAEKQDAASLKNALEEMTKKYPAYKAADMHADLKARFSAETKLNRLSGIYREITTAPNIKVND